MSLDLTMLPLTVRLNRKNLFLSIVGVGIGKDLMIQYVSWYIGHDMIISWYIAILYILRYSVVHWKCKNRAEMEVAIYKMGVPNESHLH